MQITIIGALLVAATVAAVVIFAALNSHRLQGERCRCGRRVEPYTGTRDASGELFCSTTCAGRSAGNLASS